MGARPQADLAVASLFEELELDDPESELFDEPESDFDPESEVFVELSEDEDEDPLPDRRLSVR